MTLDLAGESISFLWEKFEQLEPIGTLSLLGFHQGFLLRIVFFYFSPFLSVERFGFLAVNGTL
jgi:hypothetical protein